MLLFCPSGNRCLTFENCPLVGELRLKMLQNGRFFEYTCAYARWAHMHRFLSVCDWTKIHWTIIHNWTKIHISGSGSSGMVLSQNKP